ncbi:double-stranded DNA-binding protein [Serratia phage vB_SmaM-Kashira]|nr:hypothetical protein [Acinetobacter phage ABPH49]URC22697.1 double-stranded DNA-binding protein [Serratia phage vB_SmaM-Kashira]
MAKKDLIATIPSDPAARKRLSDTINEAVKLRIGIKDSQESLRDLIKVEKEDRDFCPKFLKTLIDGEFDKQYAAEKARRNLEGKIEQLNELDILMGRKAEPEAEDGEE